MRNVNVNLDNIGGSNEEAFILTMRNVNKSLINFFKSYLLSFILTMRNVNLVASQQVTLATMLLS